jgi:hypothetical protein
MIARENNERISREQKTRPSCPGQACYPLTPQEFFTTLACVYEEEGGKYKDIF